ncbi:VWA domain-containing protein [Streptomyces sp. NBC_00996]|uniref:VWA domain-containing protein n=1 Tax=Streptomyces sp. NBC_00996 TaxID=2903710 RepID=UPI00386A3385|nr:VWA domain-containing protein [Streptomyces sp. NBC_00996]
MFHRFKKPDPPQLVAVPPQAPPLTGVPSGLVSLAKSAAVSLEKRGLTGQRTAVYLVVDRSYSMRDYYRNGSVQHLADQALGLSVNLDDDGKVPLVMFDSQPYPLVEISLDRYQGVVAEQHRLHGGELTMGGTYYTIAMQAVIEHYQSSGASDPALVIFQTDGSPQDHDATRFKLAQASKLPIRWSFCGFGPSRVRFLERLRDLPGRIVDNASYFHAGDRPSALPDSVVYDGITKEFGAWLSQARVKGVLR